MTTADIAKKLVELNRANDMETIFGELYSPDAVSIENWGPVPEVYTGLAAIREKGETWYADVAEMHSFTSSEPLVADNSFAVTFTMDVTYKSRGRETMTELAVYTVKDGKVVREEFRA
jgi:SnoaL-like domain